MIPEKRKKMVDCLDKMIKMLERNKKKLLDGKCLENEDWADIAGTLRENIIYFQNQHIKD